MNGTTGSRAVVIEVNTDSLTPMRRIWRYVGYDEPNYTYTSSGTELLAKLGAMTDAPYYVRCHFLFCTGDGTARLKWGSTNIYTMSEDGEVAYSFEIVDKILDAQIESGCVPFVELGFMPEALSTAPEDVRYDDTHAGGWAYPPSDYTKWADLIRTFARHCLERYGLKQVSRWYWELWNEPNGHYWQGTTQEFCRLYDYTEHALHSVLPQAILGSPAIARPVQPGASEFLRDFLHHCVHGRNAVSGTVGTRLDLITFHVKGGRYPAEPSAAKMTPTIAHLMDNVQTGLEVVADFPELAGVEINLSECDPDGWAAGGRHDNPNLVFRNTEYYASYVATTVCKLLDAASGDGVRVDGMLTWAFQFEDREFFEGLRTLSTNGIDKPVLNVFRMLAHLGGQRLEASTTERSADGRMISCVAATDADGATQVLVVSHHDDWDNVGRVVVDVAVRGLRAGGRYEVTARTVDHHHANSHTAWTAMGSPQPPTAAQRQELVTASRLVATPAGSDEADEHGVLRTSVELEMHAVCLVELLPLER
ncbi:MAG: GH39 family glycosyl hydrolase [Spirochaetota bacterium]